MKIQNFKIPSTNGKDHLHTVVWVPENIELVGIVQIAHGMNEYIERYDRFARYLVKEGFVVVGNDHLGHGHTAENRHELGFVNAADASKTVVKDLFRVTKFIKRRYPELPVFLLGHSMGSFLARRYVMTYSDQICGLALLGTGYQSKLSLVLGYTALSFTHFLKGERRRSPMLQFLCFGSYNLHFLKEKNKYSWISREKDVVEQYNNDSFCNYMFTVKGYRMLLDTIRYIENSHNIDQIPKTLPIALFAGTQDPVGAYTKGVKKVYHQFLKRKFEFLELHIYKRARHELLNELEYEKTQDDILIWLQECLSRMH